MRFLICIYHQFCLYLPSTSCTMPTTGVLDACERKAKEWKDGRWTVNFYSAADANGLLVASLSDGSNFKPVSVDLKQQKLLQFLFDEGQLNLDGWGYTAPMILCWDFELIKKMLRGWRTHRSTIQVFVYDLSLCCCFLLYVLLPLLCCLRCCSCLFVFS